MTVVTALAISSCPVHTSAIVCLLDAIVDHTETVVLLCWLVVSSYSRHCYTNFNSLFYLVCSWLKFMDVGLVSCRRDNVAPLHEFTTRFTTRFCELMYDIDERVAVAGLQLLARLVSLSELSHGSVREVYRLLGSDSVALRHAAAELMIQLLEDESTASQVRGGWGHVMSCCMQSGYTCGHACRGRGLKWHYEACGMGFKGCNAALIWMVCVFDSSSSLQCSAVVMIFWVSIATITFFLLYTVHRATCTLLYLLLFQWVVLLPLCRLLLCPR